MKSLFLISALLSIGSRSDPDITPIATPLDCVSSSEKQLFQIINDYRELRGLKAIPFSQSLHMVARAHVQDLVDNYSFKQGAKCNPHTWSNKGDWSSCCYTNDHKKAECMWKKPAEIAGFTGNGYEILFYSSDGAEPAEALTGWQRSKGHHMVMVNLENWEKVTWQSMGVGIEGEYAVAWFAQEADQEGREMIFCD